MEKFDYVPISTIHPNPYQPRLYFDKEKLEELANSIKENGLIQPLIVRRSSLFGYELLAGERRLRACKLAGLTSVPVVIKELTEDDLLSQAIIENIQRDDLNPIEEAKSYQKLIEKGLTHEEVAKRMGRSRPYITNILRLLNLSDCAIQAVEEGKVSQGHARLLLSLSEKEQEKWVQEIVQKELSVRTVEQLLSPSKKKNRPKVTDSFLKEQEKNVSKLLGTPVKIQVNKQGQGKIQIHYNSLDEFDRIINNLKK